MHIYIHIPFCTSSCSYCNFARTIETNNNLYKTYFSHLKKEMQAFFATRKKCVVHTLYFGGGTPSVIPTDIIDDFFIFLHKHCSFSQNKEITIECSPQSISKEKLDCYKKNGITRISIGIQTFYKPFEPFLERSLAYNITALNLIKKYNFTLNIDMMFGFPYQKEQILSSDISTLLSFNPDHISYYALQCKTGSKIENKLEVMPEFFVYEKYYENIINTLIQKGYTHYEVYNFCKKGKEGKHNKAFWKQKNYFGFGVSAVSQRGKFLRENPLLKKYMQGKKGKWELLTTEEQREIFLQKGLRLTQGITWKNLQKFLLKIQNEQLFLLIQNNVKLCPSYFIYHKNSFSLTRQGMMNFTESIDMLLENSEKL